MSLVILDGHFVDMDNLQLYQYYPRGAAKILPLESNIFHNF